jgi:ubiquitin-protein ligase
MPNPRITRLQNDYEGLRQLAARSPFIHILGTQGAPPTKYTLQFTCRGVERLDSNGQPVYREDHRVQIELVPDYPLVKPKLQWLTPIYHPNIHNGAVCIGSGWSVSRYLNDLVIYLMQMVRYDGQGLTFTRDAFNPSAYDWAMQNRHLLLVDKRDMFHPDLTDVIKIVSSPQSGTAPVNITVLNSGSLDIRVRPKS